MAKAKRLGKAERKLRRKVIGKALNAKRKAIDYNNATRASAPVTTIRTNAKQLVRIIDTYAPILHANNTRMTHVPREGASVTFDPSKAHKRERSRGELREHEKTYKRFGQK